MRFCLSLSKKRTLRTLTIEPPKIVEEKKEMDVFSLYVQRFLLLVFVSSMKGFYTYYFL